MPARQVCQIFSMMLLLRFTNTDKIHPLDGKRFARTVLIFTERSD